MGTAEAWEASLTFFDAIFVRLAALILSFGDSLDAFVIVMLDGGTLL